MKPRETILIEQKAQLRVWIDIRNRANSEIVFLQAVIKSKEGGDG